MMLVKDDIREISRQAAKAILDHAHTLKDKECIVLALPGGRSVKGIYEELSRSDDPVWKKIQIFLVDERAVPITDHESNFRLIKESFADKLIREGILPEENLHPFIIDETAEDLGAARYTKELERYGGMFDIAVVASGEDGHIAALFPRNAALSVSGKKYLMIDDSPKPPARRITSSVELIAGAGLLVIAFIGETKREAYGRFHDMDVSIIDCPAKIVKKSRDPLIFKDIGID